MTKYLSQSTKVLSLFIMIFPSCLNLAGDSENISIRTAYSPAKNEKAVLFTKEAGATGGISYQISIVEKDHVLKKDDRGNVLIVDGNHGARNLDSTSINFGWSGSDSLLIDYDKTLRIFTQERRIGGVVIIYRPR